MRREGIADVESDQVDQVDHGLMKASWIRVFCFLRTRLGEEPPEYAFMSEREQDALEKAYVAVNAEFDALQEGKETTFSLAAAATYNAYMNAFPNLTATHFEHIPKVEQLFWNHLVRHFSNLLGWNPEDDDTINELEVRIVDRFSFVLAEEAK